MKTRSAIMTPEQTSAAVYLSILSSPVKLGLFDNLQEDPVAVKSQIIQSECFIQEHLVGIYGRDPLKAAEIIAERCYKKDISIISYLDEQYPTLLREIYRPPLVLYVKGKFSYDKTVSIVGTRNSDKVSEEITLKISSALAGAGYSIVSGMAYGIDRFAHLGALNSSGSTIGVLPGGIDTIYPYRNRDIYNMIYASDLSAVVSEYPPGIQSGQKWTFAQRNRIISGLSPALIVIQAPKGSGALITARYALEQNREVFACPGHAFDTNYEGCHELIRDGAAIVSRIEDIFSVIEPGYRSEKIKFTENEDYQGTETSPQQMGNRTPAERKSADCSHYSGLERELLESINSGISDIDIFTRNSSHSPESVLRAVTLLEIEGAITRKGNNLMIR